ncbi:MAG TPA: exodeoxyribonuclease VII large subunit [Bacteroidales bacterium]|nr:exodeoxyribonuclease VII large subunit [Bacteroidales bacterium]
MAERMTLTELQLLIRDSLYISLPEMYWVIGEISEIKENYSGHCYLELIEKQGNDNIRARIKAIIWCKRYTFLKSLFESSTGESLREGIRILVKVKVEYHELYGLSLIICDIDPAFTTGEFALKRQRIIRQLEQEGVFSMNKDLGLPALIRKIAVISSSSAAGYTDFINHLVNNESGFVYYTCLFESPVQGAETEKGIIDALDRISVHHDLFDVVVIIRGGGSQVDLSWFDNYNIAFHITQFPLPVLTGIGHEKDISVTDMVACASLKTPTAVADLIINQTALIDARLEEMHTNIRDIAKKELEEYGKMLDSSRTRLFPLSRILLSSIRNGLAGKSMRLVNFGNEFLRKASLIPSGHLSKLSVASRYYIDSMQSTLEKSDTAMRPVCGNVISRRKNDLATFEKSIELLDPANVLKRGYTITYLDGVIHKSKENLNAGDIIDTRFVDGQIRSKIM